MMHLDGWRRSTLSSAGVEVAGSRFWITEKHEVIAGEFGVKDWGMFLARAVKTEVTL
jgi:hypothetical protein